MNFVRHEFYELKYGIIGFMPQICFQAKINALEASDLGNLKNSWLTEIAKEREMNKSAFFFNSEGVKHE